MTENEEMGPKEVKKLSEKKKKKCDFFIFEIFLITNLFQIWIWIIESINQLIKEKVKKNIKIIFQRLKLWKSARKGDFWFLKSPIYEFIP